MSLLRFILKFILIIQVANIIEVTRADYENYIAFQCNRPALYFQNNKWVPDYQQNCITNEKDIVNYCQKIYRNKNISSAEPAMEKVKFTKWCDFQEKNCNINMVIRPYKCLEFNFQSDALTLPKDCLFAHLGGNGKCKNYKEWVIAARQQCAQKPDWKVKSYGMLFQCGDSKDKVKPMFFKGVEFVCCPKTVNTENPKGNDDEQAIYKHYLSHGVLTSDEEEDKVYNAALQELFNSESTMKQNVINDFRNGEMNLKSLWKTDPKLAQVKEKQLILQFKTTFKALDDQFKANREKLLEYHGDRRRFLFVTKMEAALMELDKIMEKADVNEENIISVMKPILDLLMNRKKRIIEEQNIDIPIGSHLITRLSSELKTIEHNVTDLFNKLDQIPEHKGSIKHQLVMYLVNKFPKIAFEKINLKEEKNVDKSKINQIISQYKFKQDDTDDEKSYVHFDLGLNDRDQEGHNGNTDRKFIFDQETMERQFGDKKLLFGLVFGTLVTAFVILLVGSLIIAYRHRPSLFHYSKTRLLEPQHCKQMMHGFGVDSSAVVNDTVTNGSPCNGYVNPTYLVVQTSLVTATTTSEEGPCDPGHDNLSSPLIRS